MRQDWRMLAGLSGLPFVIRCWSCSCGLAVLLTALWLNFFRTERTFLQPERKGQWGGVRLQEHSLSAPPYRVGLIAAFRLAVFRAVQENRPVETPGLASDVNPLGFCVVRFQWLFARSIAPV